MREMILMEIAFPIAYMPLRNIYAVRSAVSTDEYKPIEYTVRMTQAKAARISVAENALYVAPPRKKLRLRSGKFHGGK